MQGTPEVILHGLLGAAPLPPELNQGVGGVTVEAVIGADDLALFDRQVGHQCMECFLDLLLYKTGQGIEVHDAWHLASGTQPLLRCLRLALGFPVSPDGTPYPPGNRDTGVRGEGRPSFRIEAQDGPPQPDASLLQHLSVTQRTAPLSLDDMG